jgi:iron complex transport system substrate-binding protein
MKKYLAILLIAISLLAVVSGCQPIVATTASAATTLTTKSTSTAAAFPVTIRNAGGQDIVIEKAPQSIIVTNVWAAEILLDLVDTSRIKGVSAWGDSAAVSAVAGKAKQVANRVTTGEPEGIVTLKPDLVIIDTFSDPDGSLTKTLTNTGSVVLAMASPTDFTQIKAAIAILAAAVGETAKGQAMIDAIDAKLQAVAAKLAGMADNRKLKVIYYDAALDAKGNDTGLLCAYGAGSPFDAIARAAGLINVCDAVTYTSISKEKVVAEWKPDVMIVSGLSYNSDFSVKDDKGAAVIAAIKSNTLLQTLPAVQNGKVFALTAKFAGSTSHYMADAVAQLAAAAYPELFK